MVGIGNSEDQTTDEVQRRKRRARSFGAQAAVYAEHRPDYPEAGIRWALEAVGDRDGIVVLDLGAGTGKLTGGLLAAGVEVIAVEPDAGMRAELVRLYPGVTALSGAAEAIPLADGTVDAVLAGQAFHWFDQALAFPEIARVLRANGVFAAFWNTDDNTVEWVAGLRDVSRSSASFPPSSSDDPLPAHPLFAPFEYAEFAHSQRRTAESLTASIGTNSHTVIISPKERAEVLGRILDYLHATPETAEGEFDFPLRTEVIRAVRRANTPR
ncbi:class I SAM-dependent methyltransferase [Nocardia fluminea]|uniref:Ubiquinone/menaquinone biosynthesis C-methylase UbiE n=1 Tax=Nocardia fluminea TaxID=134984 RepID=A0A2N3WWM8_9NOCA|nr:class I SAM-dependent methyltransferase [Nocardia fluminea]PKV98301.1 ubiquinone/menaquinone biosynthesis C-methylase UbiE [Nocardia fluminea]